MMTVNQKIKTKYSELDKILEELGIIEYIEYGKYLPTEWHELKTLRVEDSVQLLSPVSVDDLVKLYEKVKSTLCNNITCSGRENGIRLRLAIRLLTEVYNTANEMPMDVYREIGRFLGEE